MVDLGSTTELRKNIRWFSSIKSQKHPRLALLAKLSWHTLIYALMVIATRNWATFQSPPTHTTKKWTPICPIWPKTTWFVAWPLHEQTNGWAQLDAPQNGSSFCATMQGVLLEWQSLLRMQERTDPTPTMQNCKSGIRAEPWKHPATKRRTRDTLSHWCMQTSYNSWSTTIRCSRDTMILCIRTCSFLLRKSE